MALWDFIVNIFPNVYDFIANLLAHFVPDWVVYLVMGLLSIVAILAFLVPAIMVAIYMERRLIGRFQVRFGPNRVGPEGILQPIADAIKVLAKEDVLHKGVDRWVFNLAPIVVFVPALLVFAVVPFDKKVILADLNVGILYVVAVGTLAVTGIFMAGWASQNKYSLFGAMRAVAQMVSYEVPMVLSILGVVIMAGSLSTISIVEAQSLPFILVQPLGFAIYFLAALAELNRTPFDILEAESEIVAGYHIEYSGMKFALFYLGEYASALAMAAILATLFLGGWKGPLLPPYLWLVIKIFAVFFVLIWVRGTWPRLRVDQVMGFAWKFLFPLALINVFIIAAEALFWPTALWPLVVVNLVVAVILVVAWTKLFQKREVRLVEA